MASKVGRTYHESKLLWLKAVCVDGVDSDLEWPEVLAMIQSALDRSDNLSIVLFEGDRGVLFGVSREEAEWLDTKGLEEVA